MLGSIHHLLSKHHEGAYEALLEAAHLVIDELPRHVIPGAEPDRDVLTVSIRDLRERLDAKPLPAAVVTILRGALDAIRVYNLETRLHLRSQGKHVEKPVAPKKAPAELPAEIEAAAPQPAGDDSLTDMVRLPGAEAAISKFLRDGRKFYLLAVIIDQIAGIEIRYGPEIRDLVVSFFGLHLAQNLGERDLVFRWSDRCFLAILNRTGDKHLVRNETQGMLNVRFRSSREIDGRLALLNFGVSSKLWHSSEIESFAHFRQILDGHLHTVE